MITEKTSMNFGFTKDENNLQLKKVFKNNAKLKEMHIDTYPNNPLKSSKNFMLLLRTYEKNATVVNDDNRLIISRNDKFGTYVLNIPFSKIRECFYEITEGYSEFILNIQNIYYRITVSN